MQIEGELIEIFDTEQVSDRFRKREFVVEYATNPDYPQFIKFELIQDRCGVLDEFRTGQRVTVEFDLKAGSSIAIVLQSFGACIVSATFSTAGRGVVDCSLLQSKGG